MFTVQLLPLPLSPLLLLLLLLLLLPLLLLLLLAPIVQLRHLLSPDSITCERLSCNHSSR
jgi:hypothetical protein